MSKKDVVAGKMWTPRANNQAAMTLEPGSILALNSEQLTIGGVEVGTSLNEVITFIVDNGSSVISTGVKGRLYLPYSVVVTDWVLGGTPSGSIQIDLWADVDANFPPIDNDSITGAIPLTISGGTHNRMSSLAGWTTTIPGDSWLLFNVDSVTDMQSVTVAVTTRRSV